MIKKPTLEQDRAAHPSRRGVSSEQRGWNITDRQAMRWLYISATACLLIFLATLPLPRVDGHLVGGDGLGYYATLRTLVIDRDLDYANDYQLLGFKWSTDSNTGRLGNPFPIGAAFLWMPFFLLAHGCSLLLNLAGLQVATNGVGYLYEGASCIGTIVYASVGFILIYKLVRRITAPAPALFAVLSFWWASNAVYYMIGESSMSHGLTVFSNALWLWLWYPPVPERSMQRWALLGAATGLVGLVRQQDLVIASVPALELISRMVQSRPRVMPVMLRGLIFAGSAALVIAPQLWMTHVLYGTIWIIPQGRQLMQWTSPHLLQVLFSTHHGLITWHPIYLVALLGLIPLWNRDRRLALVAIVAFVLHLYVNSAWARWWGDAAFGNRRFCSIVPYLVPALAIVLATRQRWRYRLVVGVLVALVIWNGLSMAQYRAGLVSLEDDLSWRELTIERLLLPWRLLDKFR